MYIVINIYIYKYSQHLKLQHLYFSNALTSLPMADNSRRRGEVIEMASRSAWPQGVSPFPTKKDHDAS